jgi:copper chaperone CopZ
MKLINLVQSIICVLLFTLPLKSLGGLKWVDVGVNGLTCSLCTRSVERSISRLDFVDSVVMSLEKTEGRIYLKVGELVDLKKIAKAVVDAGFSVRFFQLEFNFSDVTVNTEGYFSYQNQKYRWLQYKGGLTKGDVSLTLIDEGFLPRKESGQWKKKFEFSNDSGGKNVFHVVQL